MLLRRLFRFRSPTCLIVLLALVATLLPAYQVSAQERKVLLSKAQVARSFWSANWSSKTKLKAVQVESLIRDELIINVANPNAPDSFELQRRYLERLGPRAVNPVYRDNLPYDQVARAMFDAASSMPAYKEAVKKTWLLLSDPLVFPGRSNETIAKSVQAYWLDDAVLQRRDQVIAAALERAKLDPRFADTYDAIHKQELGVSIKNFDVNRFIVDHPELPIPPQVRNSVRPDGTIEISIADLKNLAKTEFGKINASIDDLQLSLVTIDLQQEVLVDYMKNEQARREAQALAEAKAREHQLKLQAADSSIYILSTLAGFIDADVGHQIDVIAKSALQIGKSLNGWLGAVAGLNGLDKLTSLSTVVMTGNILGAVINVVGLFGESEPTPDQMILEEIGKLRQQVDQLRTEMHERFDRIDQELETIYATMHDRFDKIDVQLGRINGSLEEIQKTLITMSLALSRMERNNFEFLDALGRRPLLSAMNGAVGYRERTGLDMPYQPDFIEYENIFQTWGTVNAFDALSAGPAQRDYSDGQVLAELSAYPLDANLNYLNGWLGAHGMTPFATKRLASPRDWTFASRAYARMGLDWPQHLRRISPQRQASLDLVGGDLEQAMRNISTMLTPTGPQGNAPLFDGVLAYYNTKLAALNTTIQSTETGFVREVQINRLHRTESFDLFGGIDQPLEYQAPDFIAMSCGGTEDGLAAPNNLRNIVPNYNRVTLADYMGLSSPSVCVTGEWVDEHEICHPDPFDPRVEICDQFASAQATITVYVEGVPAASRSIASGVELISGVLPMSVIRRHWASSYKPQFEALFAQTALGPASDLALSPLAASQLAVIASDLEDRLTGYQQELYGNILQGLRGLNGSRLRPGAVELAGAKKLLDSFITLGFPQAVDSDDFMRSLLYSDQQLLDDQQVIAAYVASLTPPSGAAEAISTAALTTNPRLKLFETGQKRHAALNGLVTRYLDGVSAATYSEKNTLIANARLDMRLARSFATGGGPTQSRVLLPLLQR